MGIPASFQWWMGPFGGDHGEQELGFTTKNSDFTNKTRAERWGSTQNLAFTRKKKGETSTRKMGFDERPTS